MVLPARPHPIVNAVIFGFAVTVFLIDLLAPLGYTIWILYTVPVAMCVMQQRPNQAIYLTAVMLPLMIFGFVVSPSGVIPSISVFNRTASFLAVIALALLVRRAILERLDAELVTWFRQGRAAMAAEIAAEPTLEPMATNLVRGIARYCGAQVGAMYCIEGNSLVRLGYFAGDPDAIPGEIALGSGMAGEVALTGQPQLIRDAPAQYLHISSASGAVGAAQVIIAPIYHEGKVIGVIEFGFIGNEDQTRSLELLTREADQIGGAIRAAQYRKHLSDLLEETQQQSEQLRTQQEELRETNEELVEQSRILLASQAELEAQQSELEIVNGALEERNNQLEEQKRDLSLARRKIEQDARELARSNQYKTEFLANMSHELRTPLNSSLILSTVLSENRQGNLTDEQVRFAQTIHAANNDLLTLINEVLDLSKVEAGRVDLNFERIDVTCLVDTLRQTFEPVAQQRNIALLVKIDSSLPKQIVSDAMRLQQILKNLLSNALKFTTEGEVRLLVECSGDYVEFAVEDTGIGITEEQQEYIFDAFRQADGGTSRTYGGTGLGLSISRKLADILGGAIKVSSEVNVGSRFVLRLPIHAERKVQRESENDTQQSVSSGSDSFLRTVQERAGQTVRALAPAIQAQATNLMEQEALREPQEQIIDDRRERKHERLILVIEDDPAFARILLDLAHELDFDCAIAVTGTEALHLTGTLKPSGILLDVGLPDQSGLSVLENLKHDPATRHIPVHVISGDDYKQSAFEMGVVGYAFKPVGKEELTEAFSRLTRVIEGQPQQVLIVEDDVTLGESLVTLIGNEGIGITRVGTMAEALDKLKTEHYDCMVMDLMLPDGSGFDLLEQISQRGEYAFPPVIVYTGRDLTRDEESRLRKHSRSIIVKGARSPERLLDEVTLFLHRVEATLPPNQQMMLKQARQREQAFENRRILVVEDDVRNVFALTSILEPLGATVIVARNGIEALQRVEDKQPIDLVLMDLMMPLMDGLTAMRELRKNPVHKRLPIIALTAKAMPDDRRNCLDAGASDYIAKPINVDQLISLCRVWMLK